MNILKKILLAIVILLAIPFVVALFIKKEYTVEREVLISKPVQDVFNYVKLIKNQDNYSKWNMMDPAMKKTYSGTDGTVGFVSHWESDKEEVGWGEQEITKIEEGQRIDMELRFLKPFESTSAVYMTTQAAGDNQTKVVWGFQGKMSYPMNFLLLVMDMEKMIGGDFETGLSNLKKILEK